MTNPASGAQRVLVVDDEPDITALVAYHLAKDGIVKPARFRSNVDFDT